MTPTCDTWSIGAGKCGQPGAFRMHHPAAGPAVACAEHAARWMRTRKVRGQIVRVNPHITAEAI